MISIFVGMISGSSGSFGSVPLIFLNYSLNGDAGPLLKNWNVQYSAKGMSFNSTTGTILIPESGFYMFGAYVASYCTTSPCTTLTLCIRKGTGSLCYYNRKYDTYPFVLYRYGSSPYAGYSVDFSGYFNYFQVNQTVSMVVETGMVSTSTASGIQTSWWMFKVST